MSPPGIFLDKDLLRSKAFRSLAKNGTAIIILMDFMLKRQMKDGGTKKAQKWYIANNGEITYCFSEAEKKGITRPAFCRNRDLLIERGFIDIVHNGCGGKKGDKTLYAISFRWRSWGTDKFVHQKREKDTRRGIGFRKLHAMKNMGNADVTSTSNSDVTQKDGNIN